ncbi:unnamed protein product [Rotaria sp. Silwood1]|nr:unnamed protein product [Rotaria sp. Silwood1]CAF1278095.1 unnamed protein product [Rotaria sp. Silwood1]CAF1567796.1 unnamed protein product [Rotaria sp. Silwood1]CAF3496478.1 unnamed protein product [Rotaria sp. Silwood1]CAF3542872.1 unnamed protein product [Rotaria sp. Silwood1]
MSSNQIQLSKFELIRNEVLLEILEYFSSYDIFQTFYYLNKRYNALLFSLYLRMGLLNISKKSFDYYDYYIFSLVAKHIISFRREDKFVRLLYQILLSYFISIKYLTIYNIHIESCQSIVLQLNKSRQLIYLNL